LEASALHAPTFLARRALAGPRLRLRSDDQLVALFRMGYDDAFAAIHERYRARLFTYTRQMLGGARSDAEDVLQDTFLRAYSALRQDERPVTLRAWLYRVAHNRCVDHLRRPLPAASEVFDVSRPPVLDPPAETERREDLRRLVSDMRRLPEQQRSALLMRELEGLSYTELADALGATVPAVKSLLVRARLSLVEAGEARDAACAEIRAELSLAFDRGVRMSGRSRKHMRDCAGCRGYRHALRGVHEGIGALNPGHGALAAIAKLLGLGSAGSGAATLGGGATVGGGAAGGTLAGASALGGGALAAKVAAIVSCAAVVGTGAAVEIRHHVVTADTGGTAASALKADPAARHGRRAPADTRRARKHRARRGRAVRPVTRAQAAPVQAPAVGGGVPAGAYDSPFPRMIIVTPHAPAPPMTLPGSPEATGGLLAPEVSTAPPAAPSVSAAAATASPGTPAASHAPAASLAPPTSLAPAASRAPATDPPETSAASTDTRPATTAPETTSLPRADPPAADSAPPADEPVVGISSEPDPAPADPAPARPSDPAPLEAPAEPDPGTAPPAAP
jgi:RNA polymerase sigma factor (sigma-70 family)